jgi:hypothetical protein
MSDGGSTNMRKKRGGVYQAIGLADLQTGAP